MSRFSTTINETGDTTELHMTTNHKTTKSTKPEEAGGKGSPDSVNPAPGHPGLRNDPGESKKVGGTFVAEGQPPGSVQDPTGEHGSGGYDPYRAADKAQRKADMSIPEWQREQEFMPMPSNPPPPTAEEIQALEKEDIAKISATTQAEMKAGREAIEAAKGAPGAEARAGQEANRANSGV